MKYTSQKVAYWFFALMLLFALQITYGFIMGFARIGFDNLHDFIPFNTARAVHTNLFVVWLLSGFMGAAYYIIPEEAQRELISIKWAYIQLISLTIVGVIAVVGYHFNYWEGRKFLEIPRELDYLVVVNVLLFRVDTRNIIQRETEDNNRFCALDGFVICGIAVSARYDMV